MASAAATSNKAKIARRVIEVLDYFDDNHREATVMDIVRRYDRPQSSTSELLSSLVELGMLFKDPFTRSYRLSPRAALLGVAGQAQVVRDGRLIRLIDRLSAQTGLSVALFGMVGLNVQIMSWQPGPRASAPATRDLFGGMQETLVQSAAGWLLMSTVEKSRCDGMVRRQNAEAPENAKFAFAEMATRIDDARQSGEVLGPIGFGTRAHVIARLLPPEPGLQALAVGFVYANEDSVTPASLQSCLREAIDQSLYPVEQEPIGIVRSFPTAA